MAARKPYRPTAGRSRAVLVGRVDQLRAEGLTVREIAASLGISESTYYKTRAGTRTGRVVVPRIRAAKEDEYQVVLRTQNAHGDESFQSVTIAVDRADLRALGIKNKAFAGPRLARDPQTHAIVEEAVARRQASLRRQKKGTRPWTKQEQEIASIEKVKRVRKPSNQRRFVPVKLDLTISWEDVSARLRGDDMRKSEDQAYWETQGEGEDE